MSPANKLWIFGATINMGTSDAGLRRMLKWHRQMLGLSEATFDADTDYSHLQDIPGLMLFKRIAAKDDELEFLVIELKAPRVKLGDAELAQIKWYARAVAGDYLFSGKWTFLLVKNLIDEDLVRSELRQENRPPGMLIDTVNQKVWVNTWSEVLADARSRHQWLRKQLDLQLADDKLGVRYLAEHYRNNLPIGFEGSLVKDEEK